MVGKPMAAGPKSGRDPLADESLETSRLLLDFLNAAYAARNEGGPDGDAPGSARSGSLSPHAVRAAIHIRQRGERSIGQLASGLGISYGWASRVVDELEAARFVVRERDSHDHRIVRIKLDPSASAAVEQAYRWREPDVLEALRALDESERSAVRRFLRAVTERLRQSLDEGQESTSRP